MKPELSRAAGTESLQEVRQATGEVTRRYDRAYWNACVEAKKQPMELLDALAESGLLGLGVPEERGGSGGGISEQVALIEALGAAGLPGYSFLVANFCRGTVLRYGTEAQIEQFVPPTLTGKTFTSFAITEPDAGTNSFAMRTHAVRDGDEWLLSGQKCFITAAGEASQMLVVARTGEVTAGSTSRELSMFMLPLPQDGITMHQQRIRATAPDNQYIVFFDNVRVPSTAMIGAEGQGLNYLFHALNSERVLGAAMALGLGEFALAKGVDYASTRAPFSAPVGRYQAVSHPMAFAKIQMDAARVMMYEAAAMIDEGGDPSYLTNACKYLSTEGAAAAMDATMKVHGGWAFDYDFDVVPLLETLRLFRVAPINNDMVLNYVAQHVLDLPRSY